MSARLRALPWWEQCKDFFTGPYTQCGLGIPRATSYKGLGHKLELQGPVNPQAPDGIFFATCPYCVRAATRRRRLAQSKMVIILDYAPELGVNWAIVELRPESPFPVRCFGLGLVD